MNNTWPNKDQREKFEIEEFIQAYRHFASGRHFVIEAKSEKPDYIVKDISTGERFGVELTSVYLDDRSVPDQHIPPCEGITEIPYDHQQLMDYLDCLVHSVKDKIAKARKCYDSSIPIILSIYVNEYISVYIKEEHINAIVDSNRELFDNMAPFSEIVFWPLPGGIVCSVLPDQ